MKTFTFSVRSKEGYKVVPLDKDHTWMLEKNILKFEFKEKAFSGDKTRTLTFEFPDEATAGKETTMMMEWAGK